MDTFKIITELSSARPVFHSEADFQHALAWAIHKQLPDASIRLEFKPPELKDRIYLDVWVKNKDDIFAIELKYKTKGTKLTFNEEAFDLLAQGAQDTGRYDFLKDIKRLENIKLSNKNTKGYAIFLTNDSLYWQGPHANKSSVDSAFRIHHNRQLQGELSWAPGTAKGTTHKREATIDLQGSYNLSWQNYSHIPSQNHSHFKFLLVTI